MGLWYDVFEPVVRWLIFVTGKSRDIYGALDISDQRFRHAEVLHPGIVIDVLG
jgi:hypothetical protein